jgi:hypothetical protein
VWLYIPGNNKTLSASSPEPEDSTSQWDSLCQTLAASVTSRGKLRQPKFWQRALRTRRSTTRLCGLTLPPSTVIRGVDLWMESLADSHARISPSPVSAKVSSAATGAASSTSMRGLFGRLNPDGSISKTSHQHSLFQQEESFSESLPAWGSMRSGELYAQPTWAPVTAGSGSGFWPTVQAHDSQGGDANRVGRFGTEHGGRNLADDVMLWHTPLVNDVEKRGEFDAERTACLPGQAQTWATPHASMMTRAGSQGRDGGLNLQTQVSNWGTPTTRDMLWKTPCAMTPNALGGSGVLPAQGIATGHQVDLINQVMDWEPSSHPDPQTSIGPMCWCGIRNCGLRSHRRRLNPLFVEWLMGWPISWTSASTALEPAAMELWRYRAQSLLESLCAGQRIEIEMSDFGLESELPEEAA